MKTLSKLLALGLFLALLSPSFAQAKPAKGLIALKFHADWCGGCKKMGARLTELGNKLPDQPVLLLKLDLTDEKTRHQAALLSASLGLQEVYQKYNNKTGFILLIDGQSKKVLAKMGYDQNASQMVKSIKNYL